MMGLARFPFSHGGTGVRAQADSHTTSKTAHTGWYIRQLSQVDLSARACAVTHCVKRCGQRPAIELFRNQRLLNLTLELLVLTLLKSLLHDRHLAVSIDNERARHALDFVERSGASLRVERHGKFSR